MYMTKKPKEKLKDYILLSPIGDHRAVYLDDFLDAVRKFTPPPKEIVLCFDIDTIIDVSKYSDVVIRYSPELFHNKSYLPRIASAREILRKYFIYHPAKYETALWIDCDIIAPPELPAVLHSVMEEEEVHIVVNKYDGRTPGRQWCGSGVMLTSRTACTASIFHVGNIYTPDGEEKHLSEDFCFFAIFDQGRHFLKIWTGRSGRICDEYVRVEHLSVSQVSS